MKIVFVSNYLNHHQLPVAIEMCKRAEEYHFIATQPISQERLSLGYVDMNSNYPWVIKAYESLEEWQKAETIIESADIVIFGAAPDRLIRKRLKQKKIVFYYSERIYKKKCEWYKWPLRLIKNFFKINRHKNSYMLCASAYTATDYAKTFSFWNKTYKWGYFVEVKKHRNIIELISKKKKGSILWVARFIDWKHPEIPIEIVDRLKKNGYAVQLNMIGNGIMQETISNKIRELGLEDSVHMLGSMSPEMVRTHMEQSEIFLFTSDRNEGWGAVLGEAMNSACAVVASHMIGATPFLIKNNENGLVYKDGNVEELYSKVKWLLDNPEQCMRLGKKAYETMTEQWNPEFATDRIISLYEDLKATGKCNRFQSGPCSRAERIEEKI